MNGIEELEALTKPIANMPFPPDSLTARLREYITNLSRETELRDAPAQSVKDLFTFTAEDFAAVQASRELTEEFTSACLANIEVCLWALARIKSPACWLFAPESNWNSKFPM